MIMSLVYYANSPRVCFGQDLGGRDWANRTSQNLASPPVGNMKPFSLDCGIYRIQRLQDGIGKRNPLIDRIVLHLS